MRYPLASALLAATFAAASACGGEDSSSQTAGQRATPTAHSTATAVSQEASPHWVKVSTNAPLPDSFAGYVFDTSSGTLWRIDSPDPTPDTNASITGWTPDGRAVAYRRTDSFSRFYAGRPGEAMTPLLPFDTDGSAIEWSPDGRYLAVSGRQKKPGEVVVLGAATFEQLAAYDQAANGFYGWSSDGRYLALGSDTKIVIWDWRSNKMQEVVGSKGAWSTSGLKFAYEPQAFPTASEARTLDVRIKDFGTGDDTLATTLTGGDINSLFWAPDGRTIAAWYTDAGFQSRTMLIDVASRTRTALITSSWPEGWSGSTLLLNGNVCTGFDVITVQEDGGGLRNYTNSDAMDLWPHWSPDGRAIAYTTYGQDSVSLASLDIASGTIRKLASGAFNELSVIGWSLDSKQIAFHFGGGKGLCEGDQQYEKTTVQLNP